MNLAINGFGRIGRQVLRIIFEKHPDINVVLINDLTDPATLAHLFEFDSSYGIYADGNVSATADGIVVNGKTIKITAIKDPKELPHKEMSVDVVLECTGRFTKREDAALHLQAGAKKVILSAPAKGDVDGTFCMGVNNDKYDPQTMHVISNASCTTNCLAPMSKVLHENFGIVSGLMTTIHSYTNDQNLLDLPHKDLRRARAAAVNIVPTSTGAAKAIGLVIPELAGKMNGTAMRVPTPTGSITDLTFVSEKEVSVDAINAAFEAAANGPLKGILRVEKRPIVSHDIVHDSHGCIIDSALTQTMGKNMAKVFGWYDNEWGYSTRLVELAAFVGSKI
ncbi:MAG TPA: type I glyceraldehyde-3-phosphate dehydrogenase [Candidatus Peribacteraceae bacterium]|nr:type I glyceraldehyde-3-phosphate dehydrogenase [Candidatus Peribacteraceae bacterium]